MNHIYIYISYIYIYLRLYNLHIYIYTGDVQSFFWDTFYIMLLVAVQRLLLTSQLHMLLTLHICHVSASSKSAFVRRLGCGGGGHPTFACADGSGIPPEKEGGHLT